MVNGCYDQLLQWMHSTTVLLYPLSSNESEKQHVEMVFLLIEMQYVWYLK